MTSQKLSKLILIMAVLLLTACGSDDDGDKNEAQPTSNNTAVPAVTEVVGTAEAAVEPTAAPATTAPTAEVTEVAAATDLDETQPEPGSGSVQLEDADQLLVWTAPASAPGNHLANATGDLAYLDSTGTLTTLVKVPDQASHVEPCGANATSPDGRYFAFFMGLDTQLGGTLYMMTDGEAPAAIEQDMQFLGCRGGDSRLQYSPDSSQIGYVAYEPDAKASEFGDGVLHIRNTSDLSEIASFNNVVSFDIGTDGVAFVNFYTDENNLANEAAIFWWDGSVENEVTNFTSKEGCRYIGSYTQVAPDGQLWTILGERCRNVGTEWQLYRVDVANKNALLGLAQPASGAMVSYSQINNLFFTPDGSRLYFTLPDGVSNNSVALYMVSMDDLAAPRQLVERDLRVATYSGSSNASPLISPDGTKLAFVRSTPDVDTELHVYDMANPDAAPLIIPTGNRGDTIPFMQYAPDGSLVYLVGGTGSEGNAILVLRPGSTTPDSVRRGTYSPWAVLSPDGSRIAVLEWVPKTEGVRGDTFLHLMIVDLATRETAQLFQGGEIIDNQTQNMQFARPLLWVLR